MKRRPSLYILLALGLLLLTIAIGYGKLASRKQIETRQKLSLEQRIDLSWQIAEERLKNTLAYLKEGSLAGRYYPEYTKKGRWHKVQAKSWAAGFLAGSLWKMSLHTTDREQKVYWVENAKKWGDGQVYQIGLTRDITANNLFVFAPWFEQAQGKEKTEQLQNILAGAKYLSESFHEDIGTFGIMRKSKRDRQEYWQAFIDHIINVEQILWAAEHTPSLSDAKRWQSMALRHLKTLGKTFGKNRHPGESGTWQRGYFDHRQDSPTYTKFLFNEGKQGWRDGSTWSRGQAWVIYGLSVAYSYTKDLEILQLAQENINYFLAQSQLSKDGIAPWDFDYAHEHPEPQRDSSATAIALSGILKLLTALPAQDANYFPYTEAVKKMLLALTNWEYLGDGNSPQISILQHGCYHHPASLTPSQIYDNGLIWGDYFFLDALLTYQQVF